MKRARHKRNANSNPLQGRRGEEKDVRGALSSADTEIPAGKDLVDGGSWSSDVETFGRKAGAKGGSQTQVSKRKDIRNNPTPSAETLLNRHKFDAGLRRGLLQAATNNSPLPEWLLRRKSYDRAGEFFVRLKAELVTPERRSHAKIKSMLAEHHSSQQRDAKQHDGADDKMPGQDFGHTEELDAEDGNEVPVEKPTKAMHQRLSGMGGQTQSAMNLNPNTTRYQDGLRRGLLEAAEHGTFPNGYIQARSVAGLGDFWVRLKTELVSTKRDELKIKRMLDELRDREEQGAEAEQEEAKVGEEEASSEQPRNPGNFETGVKLRDQQVVDDNDSDDEDDVFVRRPRRRHRLLASQQFEEELQGEHPV